MQGWTATKRYGVTRKRSTKWVKRTGNLFKKAPIVKRCLLIVDLGKEKGKHSMGREFQSLAVWGMKLLS